MNRLPLEIVDNIASYLSSDPSKEVSPQTLASLALTSRTLHNIAEVHLYRSVSCCGGLEIETFLYALLKRPARTKFVRTLSVAWAATEDKIHNPAFNDFVTRTASERLQKYVSEVDESNSTTSLAVAEAFAQGFDYLLGHLYFNHTTSEVLLILHLLPSLRSLEITLSKLDPIIYLAFPDSDPSSCKTIPAGLQNLRSLTITHSKERRVRFKSFPPDFVLCCFRLPRLEELRITHVGGDDKWRAHLAEFTTARATSTVTQLRISNIRINDASLLAALFGVPQTLEVLEYIHVSVTLDDWTPRQFSELGDALRTLTSLKRLEIVDWSVDEWTALGTLGSLRGLTNLTHLHVPTCLLLELKPPPEEPDLTLEDVLPESLLQLDLDFDRRWSDPAGSRQLLSFVRKSRLRKLWLTPDEDDLIRSVCWEAGVTFNHPVEHNSITGWRWAHP